MAKKLALETSSAMMIRGIGAFAALLFNFVAARYIPAQEAGYLFLSMSVVMVMIPLGLLGLGRSQVRFISIAYSANEFSEVSRIARHSQTLAALGLLTVTSLTYVFSGTLALHLFEKPEVEPILKTISPSILFLGLCYLFGHQLQGVNLRKKSIFVMSIGTPLIAVTIFYVLGDESAISGASAYTYGAIITTLIAALWWIVFLRKSHARDSSAITSEGLQYRDLMRSCLPLWAVAVFSQWSISGIHILAGIYVEGEELAQLSIALRITNLISFILIAVKFVVAPRFARLYKSEDVAELTELVRQAGTILLGWSAPVVIGMCLYSSNIMLLFGKEYQDGAILLVILCGGQLINALTGHANTLLVMSGHEKDVRNIVCSTGIIAVFVGLFLIQLWGALGAALVIAVAAIAQNLCFAYLVKKRVGINVLRLLKRS